jgi:hypothetical protein
LRKLPTVEELSNLKKASVASGGTNTKTTLKLGTDSKTSKQVDVETRARKRDILKSVWKNMFAAEGKNEEVK